MLDAAAFAFLIMTTEDEQHVLTSSMKQACFRDGSALTRPSCFWRKDAKSSLIYAV
jgi:hypothetical protein